MLFNTPVPKVWTQALRNSGAAETQTCYLHWMSPGRVGGRRGAGGRKPPCRYWAVREGAWMAGVAADEASRWPRLCSRLWWRLSQLGPPRCDLGSPCSRTALRVLPAPDPRPLPAPRMFIRTAGGVAGRPGTQRPRAPSRPLTHPQWRSSLSPAGRHCRRALRPAGTSHADLAHVYRRGRGAKDSGGGRCVLPGPVWTRGGCSVGAAAWPAASLQSTPPRPGRTSGETREGSPQVPRTCWGPARLPLTCVPVDSPASRRTRDQTGQW